MIFRGRGKLHDAFDRRQGLSIFSVLLKSGKRGLVGFQSFPPVLLLNQLRVMKRLERSGDGDFQKLLEGDNAFGHVTNFHFLFKD